MEFIFPSTQYENLKRCWRRRKYQRLNATNNRRKVKVMRFGGSTSQLHLKIRKIPKLHFKMVSPMKILAKFHDAYVDLMIRMAGSVVPKGRQVAMVSSGLEVADSRLVLEIYKRLAASRELYGV